MNTRQDIVSWIESGAIFSSHGRQVLGASKDYSSSYGSSVNLGQSRDGNFSRNMEDDMDSTWTPTRSGGWRYVLIYSNLFVVLCHRPCQSSYISSGGGDKGELAKGLSHLEILISECEPFFPQET
jgi:hypothetical protein